MNDCLQVLLRYPISHRNVSASNEGQQHTVMKDRATITSSIGLKGKVEGQMIGNLQYNNCLGVFLTCMRWPATESSPNDPCLAALACSCPILTVVNQYVVLEP